MTEDSDIKLSNEAERLLLESSSSATSKLKLDDWENGFRAAFDLQSSTKLTPNAVEPLRSIACLMAQTTLPTLSNFPDAAFVSLATMQWTAANALFGCPSHDDKTTTTSSALTTNGTPFPCNEVPMTDNTDDARKLLAKNGYLRIEVTNEPPPLLRTANEWLLTCSTLLAPLDHSEEFTLLRIYAEEVLYSFCRNHKVELTWDRFWGVLFDSPDCGVTIPLKRFALSLARTPPTFFYRDFTDGGGDQPICGFLLPNSATNQWYGAMKVFGTPWYDPSSHNIVRGVQWTAVLLPGSTTMQGLQEEAIRAGLKGLTSSEVHNDDAAYACVTSAMTRAGYEIPNELDVGNWHFVFLTAFATDQKILTDREATSVKVYAARLSLTEPSSFGILYVVDDANPNLGFLSINATTAPWLAAATIFGYPLNLSGGGRDQPSTNRNETACQSTTTGSAADVNGSDVYSTLDKEMKKDLMIAISTYTPTATYYAKVVVAGSIAAALSQLSLIQFALPQTDTENAAVLKWYNAEKKLPFPKFVELKEKRFNLLKKGYEQLKDATTTEKTATAIRLQLGLHTHRELPKHKRFMEFLRCFRRTVHELRHMDPKLPKEGILASFHHHFKGCKTAIAFKKKRTTLHSNYFKNHNKRIQQNQAQQRKLDKAKAEEQKTQVAKEAKIVEAEKKRKHDEAQAEAKKKQDEAKKKDDEAQAEAKKKQDEAQAEAKKKQDEAQAEAKKKQDKAQAKAKKKQDDADDAQRKRDDEQHWKKDEEASKEPEADDDYSNNRGADDAPTTSEDDSELEVSGKKPAEKIRRKTLCLLPLRSNKRSKLEHERPALLQRTSTEATITFDSPPILDDTGKYSPPGDNWKQWKMRMAGMFMRLVIILEHEDNIISPRNAWKSAVCKDFNMSDPLNDHTATCFISLIFSILLVLKKNR